MEHFRDAITYSIMALRASCIFFIHGLYPDIYEKEGGELIKQIDYKIEQKKKMIYFKSA